MAVLEKLAVLALDDGRIEEAAALTAAALRIRTELGFERSTPEKERLDRFVSEAPEAAWAPAFHDGWARGRRPRRRRGIRRHLPNATQDLKRTGCETVRLPAGD